MVIKIRIYLPAVVVKVRQSPSPALLADLDLPEQLVQQVLAGDLDGKTQTEPSRLPSVSP